MSLLLLLGNSGFKGALDSLGAGLESAWSVGRRLRAAYTGPIIRVRRSSDNAESDFYGSGANGAVSAAAVEAFCGAGDGFLTTIYGQSGHGRNLTQSTTTVQPQVVSSGVAITRNGNLAARFSAASSRRMSVAASTATYNFLHTTGGTLYAVHQSDDTAANKYILQSSTTSGVAGFRFGVNTAENFQVICSRIDSSGVPATGVSASVTFSGSATTSIRLNSAYVDPDNGTAANKLFAWQDTAALSGTNASSSAPFIENANSNLSLGGSQASDYYTGDICEVVIWSSDVTASRTTWEANAKAFWGAP